MSAAERDKILINEAKDDKEARQNFTEVMKESNQCLLKFMECMSKSMSDIGAGISRSMEMIAQASSNHTHQLLPVHPVHQNISNQGMQHNYTSPMQYPIYQEYQPYTGTNTMGAARATGTQNPNIENQFINLN